MNKRTSHRRGFTAIELLIVLGVVVTLFALTAPVVFRALRESAVRNAAQAIVQLHHDARRLAIEQRQPDDPSGSGVVPHYGVVVVNDPTRDPPCYAALTYGHPQDGFSSDAERMLMGVGRDGIAGNDDDEPANLIEFNRRVQVYNNDYLLSDTSGEIGWYYQYRTGITIAEESGDLSSSAYSIGGYDQSFTGIHYLDYVSSIDTSESEATVPTIAPSIGTPDDPDTWQPGLSVRLIDDSVRVAVMIHAPGVETVEEF